MRQSQQTIGDLLLSLEPVARQVGGIGHGTLIGRIIGVMQTVFGVGHDLPGINPGAIGGVVVRLQAVPGGQFDVGHHEIELETPLVTMLDPQTVVLVAIKTRQQGLFEGVHDLTLGGVADIRFLKGQHARGVLLGVPAAVDQLLGLVGITTQQHCALAVPILSQQITHRAAAASGTA